MFIARNANPSTNSVRRSGIQLKLYHSHAIPLLRTEREIALFNMLCLLASPYGTFLQVQIILSLLFLKLFNCVTQSRARHGGGMFVQET